MGLGQTKSWQGQALRGVFSLKYLLGKERIGALLENVQENLVESLKTHFETEGSGKVRPVAVEHNIDLETFRTKYQAKNRPVVLKGAAAHWECVRKWDLDYLSKEYGSDPVDLLNPSGFGDERCCGAINTGRFHSRDTRGRKEVPPFSSLSHGPSRTFARPRLRLDLEYPNAWCDEAGIPDVCGPSRFPYASPLRDAM